MKINNTLDIVLLGFPDRAGLGVLRSLSELLPKPEIVIITDDKNNLANASKYKSIIKYHTPLEINYNKASSEILQYLNCKKRLLIPCNDAYLKWVLLQYDNLCQQHVIPYNPKSVEEIINKFNILKVAKDLNIKTPKYLYIKNNDQIHEHKKNLKFPCILKPIQSVSFKNNQFWKLQVEKVNSFDELEMLVKLKLPQSDILIQDYLIGSGYAANISAINGKITHYFEYRRLHEPGFGGGSSLRESLKPSPEIIDQCESLINAFNYSGIGMVEFRLSGGDFYIMEFNARFWGSLSLPIFCGMDFPKILYSNYLKGKNEYSKKSKINFNYKVNSQARNFLADLKWHLLNGFLETFKFMGFVIFVLPINLFKKKEILDIERLSDIGPTLHIYKQLINLIIDNFKIILLEIWFFLFKYYYRKVCKKNLSKIDNIHFVCLGNINRSVFAERYLKNKSREMNVLTKSSLLIKSSGTLPLSGRPCSSVAINTANDFGVSLKNHFSKCIFREKVKDNKSLLIFTMDIRQYLKIRKSYKNSYIIPLGIFSSNKVSISDPYNGNDLEYKSSFYKIVQSIDTLVKS